MINFFMSQSESISDFYTRIIKNTTHNNGNSLPHLENEHFNVLRRNDLTCKNYISYKRRDFYKISFIIGSGTLNYADKGIKIKGKALLFSNPNIPYAWEADPVEQSGYFCLFTNGFVNTNHQSENLQTSPLFKIGGDPLYFINDEQAEGVGQLFEKMFVEIGSNYQYKYDLIRNYMNLIMHEAMKMQPANQYFKHTDAASRITAMFMELLERQFPVSHDRILGLRSANDYALHLSVHTNHLNKAVKKVTGKTTTEYISARVIKEAKILLKHTDWTITQVAWYLGFESQAYFDQFFRKQTNKTPRSYRER